MLYAKLVLMAVFWSGVFPAIHIVLRSTPLFTSVALRFAAAAVLLCLLLWVRGAQDKERRKDGRSRLPRLTPREAVLVLVLGLVGISLYNSLFTAGLGLVEASRAALIVPTNPAFTALFAALFLGERMGMARIAGVMLSVAGALWVLARGDLSTLAGMQFGLGEFYLVLCIFTWSAYTLLGRVALASVPALALTAYVMVVGAVPLAVLAWAEQPDLGAITLEGWAALAYLVVFGTVIPFLWYYEGIQALGAARAAQFINLVPPMAVAASIWLLGEPFTPALLVGALLVVAGLYLTNLPKR